MASNIPAKIGKYDVVSLIGRGGMGVVYKAMDPHLDRQVAIKMMTGGFADNPDLLKRFFREAQSLGSLQHPNIVTVYDLGDYDGNPYLVMEFLEGEGLDTVFTNRRQLSFLEKSSVVIQVCNGLAYAHQRGVVHRDIKPANIMLAKDGSVKIFDFGIAHIGDESVTKTGQMIGTPSYMSPEQVNGKPLDARTDLFSTGVVLYQLFAGRLPFEGDSTANTFLKILYDPPLPLKNFLPACPQELETILLRALAKDPSDRYHSAEEFALELGQLQAQFKQDLVAQYMREVSVLLEKADLYKARELLFQVLKVNPQQVPATQLLREVQQRIKKEEIGEQVRKLRQGVEEAIAHEQFDAAQSYLDQALALDKGNPDLHRLAESVRTGAVRVQKLHNALKLAESAHQDGDLDTAKQSVEQALEIYPDDAQAKALYRVIQRDWVERSRQQQLENYLFEARQDISSRKFTAALEILKLAEALDPGAPQVHALLESAEAGREQERRRKDLEAITRDVEDALNRDDYRGACQKADEGLARFPEERTLLKLRTLADRQRQIEERRQFIDEQLGVARKLLQEGRNDELLTSLRAAIEKIGPETRLQSLLTIVTENVQRERLERRKSEFLQQAKDSLRSKQYDSAIHALERARAELHNEPEIEELLQFANEEAAADKRRRAAEAAAEKAQAFVAEQKYDDAIRLLEANLRESPDEELRIVLAETRRAAIDYQQKLESTLAAAEKLLQARKANEAVKLLESQPTIYYRNPALAKLRETAYREAERLQRVQEAIEHSQRLCEAGDYLGARRLLDECRRVTSATPELDAQGAAIEKRRIAAASEAVGKALGDARVLVMAAEYQAALDKLQTVAQLAVDVPNALRSDYHSVQQQCTVGLVHSRKTQIERFVAGGELTRAAELLKQSLAQFPSELELSKLGKVLEQETIRRTDAQEKLADAQATFARGKWREGADLLKIAFASANRAPAVQERVLDAFVQAGVSAVESDWRSAEFLLQQLAELQPGCSPPSVLWARIRERKREESLAQIVVQVKRLISSGQLQEALRELGVGFKAHTDDTSLLELQKTIHERIRQAEEQERQEQARIEKEGFLRELNSQLGSEPALDRRIIILDKALIRYPQEPLLQQQSVAVRELWKRVSDIVTQAGALEEAGKYDEALSQWNALRTIHRTQPELEGNVARVTRLRDQARAKARAGWLERVQRVYTASDLEGARSLLLEAMLQFPADPDLTRLETQINEAIKARTKAQKRLVDATKSFERSHWTKGIDALNGALEVAGNDAFLRQEALRHLAKAAETALGTDLASAQLLSSRAAALQPNSPLVPALQGKIEERKREQAIVENLSQARRAQQAGDLDGALRELALGIKEHPGDQRLIQAKYEVEQQLQQLEEQRAGQRERLRQLEQERERKRQEESERERQRLESLEQERVRAKQREQEQAHARELELERQRENERERQDEEKLRAEQERFRKEASRREQEAERLKRKAEPQPEIEPASPGETRRFVNVNERANELPREGMQPAGAPPTPPGMVAPSDEQSVSRLFHSEAHPSDHRTQSGALTSLHNLGWQEEILHAMEKELAVFIGPLARIIVKKNATKTTDPEQLFKLLAESLERDSERQAFLSRKSQLSKGWPATKIQETPEVTGTFTFPQALAAEFTPEALDRAAHLIAVHLGPISKIVVRKEARQANSLRALYLRLADHVEDPSARARFLQEAGY